MAAGPLSSPRPASIAPARPPTEVRRSSVAYFQYIGTTGIVVTGPSTGTRYRFETNGAVVAVALGDRAALAMVPRLRQVAGP